MSTMTKCDRLQSSRTVSVKSLVSGLSKLTVIASGKGTKPAAPARSCPPEHPSRKRDTRAGWVAAGTSAPLSKLVSRLSSQTTHVLVFNRSDSLRAPALAENHVDTWGPAGSARPGMRPAGARKAFYG